MATREDVSIVQATQKDIDLLSRLIRDGFADVANRFGLTPQNCPKHPSNYTHEWVEKDLERGLRYFILIADGTAVGCVGVERATETTCYLERLAVLPQLRGIGYGSQLTQYALTQAEAMGATEVGIGIIAADSGLKAFYQSLGFEAGPTKRFAHLPFDVAFMRIFFDHGMISGGSLSARD